MAAITAITLADGQATPVNHTFVPFQPQMGNQPAVWLEKSNASPTGWFRLTQSVTKNGAGVYKVKHSLSIPVLAVAGAGCCVDANTPVISYTEFFNGEFSLPAGTTSANRKDIRAYIRNLYANAVIGASIEDLEIAY